MKLALECRADMLEMVQPFGDFDFILAKEVLDNEEVAEFYKNSSKIKFVDNSVNEEGVPLGLEQLKQAMELVKGDFVISPDWIGEYEKTISMYNECIKVFGPERTVGVIQGKTFEEALKCLATYGEKVAVPYDICSKKTDPPWLMALRRALVVSKIPNNIYIHLLGYDSLDEFIWYKDKPGVYSIDTGAPVLLGLQERDILDPLESKEFPTYNQMAKLNLSQTAWTAICRNIALLRRYIS